MKRTAYQGNAMQIKRANTLSQTKNNSSQGKEELKKLGWEYRERKFAYKNSYNKIK